MSLLFNWIPRISPNVGDLRVWYWRNGETYYLNVDSIEEAKRVIETQAFTDLQDSSVTVNTFGLDVYENDRDYGKWFTWYDDNDNDIDYYLSFNQEEEDECGNE